MEVTQLSIADRIVLCMNEFNRNQPKGGYRPFKSIDELDEKYKSRITGLSEKYNVSEKTIYSIVGYRYP